MYFGIGEDSSARYIHTIPSLLSSLPFIGSITLSADLQGAHQVFHRSTTTIFPRKGATIASKIFSSICLRSNFYPHSWTEACFYMQYRSAIVKFNLLNIYSPGIGFGYGRKFHSPAFLAARRKQQSCQCRKKYNNLFHQHCLIFAN